MPGALLERTAVGGEVRVQERAGELERLLVGRPDGELVHGEQALGRVLVGRVEVGRHAQLSAAA